MKRAYYGIAFILTALSATLLSVSESEIKLPTAINAKAYEIMEARCFPCHSGSNQLGDLLLDTRQAAIKGGGRGAALVPGDPNQGLFISVIEGTHPDIPRMPMDGGDFLTAEEIAILKRWIKDGAQYQQQESIHDKGNNHWAYQKPERPSPPSVSNDDWVRNPIDRFILARLDEHQMAPQDEASPEQLIRRVSLDLTGLLPTPEEVESFVNDSDDQSYEALIQRLFDRPEYGEHMGRYWLDLARYADTNGYQVDKTRRISLYREWVINAFNQNMPFDQFTIEQLAGDLLPEPTKQQLVATGFHRNTQTNEEGGVKDEEYRRRAIVNRVDTTSTVWLGSTMACAECHDHKYDPFTQEEFYQFFAFFNQTEDKGNSFRRNTPFVTVATEIEQKAIDSVDSLIDLATANLDTVKRSITPELNEWENRWHRQKPTSWIALDPVIPDDEPGEKPEFRRDQTFELPEVDDEGNMQVYLESPKMHVKALRIEFLPNPSRKNKDVGNLLNEIELITAVRKSESEDIPITLNRVHSTYETKNNPITHITDGDPVTGWDLNGKADEPHSVIFELKTGQNSFNNGPLVLLKINRPNDGYRPTVRVSITEFEPEDRHPIVPNDVIAILKTPQTKRTKKQNNELRDYYYTISPTVHAFQSLKDSLVERKKELETNARSSMVMSELPDDQMRDTHIHIRGNYLTPGKEVTAAVPAVLHEFPEEAEPNRLTLAKWLMDANNPLTARVAVNRLWQQVFGVGIVDTSEDFGTRASPPSHPELLDWLAVEFIESGWDVQHMMKLILTSATYQQSSKATLEKIEKDPKNRLLSRGPRFRMDAELIRDNALEAAGILYKKIGGESVFPPHPLGIWKEIGFLRPYFGMSRWPESFGADRYRRGMYTFWRRTIPYPTFATFDAPSREMCTVKRPRTNTPLQALLTLNDPAFFEAAQALAARLIDEGGDVPEDRIRLAYQLCLSRKPKPEEMQTLLSLTVQQLEHYSRHPKEANRLLESSPVLDVIEDIPKNKVEWAAWTVTANVMLNLDEFITKG